MHTQSLVIPSVQPIPFYSRVIRWCPQGSRWGLIARPHWSVSPYKVLTVMIMPLAYTFWEDIYCQGNDGHVDHEAKQGSIHCIGMGVGLEVDQTIKRKQNKMPSHCPLQSPSVLGRKFSSWFLSFKSDTFTYSMCCPSTLLICFSAPLQSWGSV